MQVFTIVKSLAIVLMGLTAVSALPTTDNLAERQSTGYQIGNGGCPLGACGGILD